MRIVHMKKLLAAATLALSLAVGASAQKIDANGKCHSADGKLAKMSVCKPAPKADAKAAKCKDANGKFAKCSAPGAKPVT
jgi:hypothetical protein